MSIFDKFKLGLSKSSKNLSSGLNDLIFKKKIDENMLNELEDFLIQSDVGVESAKELREKFANTKVNPKTVEKDEIFKIFSNYVYEILKPLEKNLENINKNKPSVILIAGVNGVGKTTTIGKLGKVLGQNNKLFPEKCNVTIAKVVNNNLIKVKVWERGAGSTKACGTAACATAVSAAVLKLSDRCIDIEFSEGLLHIDWQEDNNICMTGKVSEVKKITVNI